MISFDRKDFVLLWKNNRKEMATCRFCFLKKQYDYLKDVSGNCPIGYGHTHCDIDDNNYFSNIDCIVYATIYKCLIKKTECFRDCSECVINNTIKNTII